MGLSATTGDAAATGPSVATTGPGASTGPSAMAATLAWARAPPRFGAAALGPLATLARLARLRRVLPRFVLARAAWALAHRMEAKRRLIAPTPWAN
eukprot:5832305-Lingulodinium_polyedra.AAC.1